jgi:hypothetical protein
LVSLEFIPETGQLDEPDKRRAGILPGGALVEIKRIAALAGTVIFPFLFPVFVIGINRKRRMLVLAERRLNRVAASWAKV